MAPGAGRWAAQNSVLCSSTLFSPLLLLVLAFASLGCTSMGFHDYKTLAATDFGPPKQVRMCVYLDDGVSEERARDLLTAWDSEAALYNLRIEPVSFEHHSRHGLFHWQIMNDIRQIPLKSSCDRMIYFANRNIGDFVYGLGTIAVGLPEVLGEVDDATLTHGFVYARTATPAQLLISPSRVTRHELYHLLGCGHHFDMTGCYRHIQYLKQSSDVLNASGYDLTPDGRFYPTYMNRTDSLLVARSQVNAISHAVDTGAAAEK